MRALLPENRFQKHNIPPWAVPLSGGSDSANEAGAEMGRITVYQKPTCTTCRQVYAALKESGVDFEAVDYYMDPIPKAKLEELLRKMGISAAELLRKNEDMYKQLKLSEKKLSDDQIVDLMIKHPDLIQRPIVEKGAKAILARPAERLKEIL